MALLVKALLSIAIVLLPGGLLLVPVLIAFHERDRRTRVRVTHLGAREEPRRPV